MYRAVLDDGTLSSEITGDPREYKSGKLTRDVTAGRDVLNEGEFASVLIAFRIDPRDRSVILQAAAEAHLTLSEFIRRASISVALSANIRTLSQGKTKRWSEEQEKSVVDFLSRYPSMSFSSKQIAKATGIMRKQVSLIVMSLLSQGTVEIGRPLGLSPRDGKRYLPFYKITVNQPPIEKHVGASC